MSTFDAGIGQIRGEQNSYEIFTLKGHQGPQSPGITDTRSLSENRKSTRQLLRYVGSGRRIALHCSTPKRRIGTPHRAGTPDRNAASRRSAARTIHVVVRKSHFGPFLRSFSFMYRMYGMLVLQRSGVPEQKPVNMSNYAQWPKHFVGHTEHSLQPKHSLRSWAGPRSWGRLYPKRSTNHVSRGRPFASNDRKNDRKMAFPRYDLYSRTGS